MSTIKDIARETGFSIATVSMVLNDKPGISEETRKKVLKAAKKLKYVASVSAKTLKTRKSRAIGLVIGQLDNPFFTQVTAAAERVARSQGYNIFIANAEMDCGKAVDILKALKARSVDGTLISLSVNPTPEYVQNLHALIEGGMPIISVSFALKGHGIPLVTFDVQEQLTALVERLIGLGHRHIAMLAATRGSWLNQRLDYFRAATSRHGLFREEYIRYLSFLSLIHI